MSEQKQPRRRGPKPKPPELRRRPCSVAFNEGEKQKALALAQSRGLTLAALFRQLVDQEISRQP